MQIDSRTVGRDSG